MVKLRKENRVKRFDILEDGRIIVHEAVVIKRDGQEVSSKVEKKCLDPGVDEAKDVDKKINGYGKEKAKKLAESLWTEKKIKARKKVLEAEKAEVERFNVD